MNLEITKSTKSEEILIMEVDCKKWTEQNFLHALKNSICE